MSEPLPRRRLGTDGPEVSLLGLGTNNLGFRIGLDEARPVIDAALDEGVTLFDTADVYGGRRERAAARRAAPRPARRGRAC